MVRRAEKVRVVLALVVGGSAFVGCGDADEAGSLDTTGTDAGAPASLCPEGKAVAWPAAPYGVAITSTLPPDSVFDGASGPVRVNDYFEPCAAESRLLLIRTSAAWCGACLWHAEHTARLLDVPRFAGRLQLLDLVVADEDNMPPTVAAVARWRARIDWQTKVALDPGYTFARSLLARNALPAYVIVDTRTMRVVGTEADPPPEGLQNQIDLTLAQLDGRPRPHLVPPKLFDGVLTEDQLALLRGMKLPAAPPPDPTNEVGDLLAAAALGKDLFADTALSPAGVACAKCHDVTKSYSDGIPQSIGVSTVDRNAPSVALAAHARWQFWDGRADTLWMQALGPPENDAEMASNRLYIAHQIAGRDVAAYTSVFGAKYPLPDLEDGARFPANGKPGDAAWTSMAPADRDDVTRIYVNVGKAIAAFERSLRVLPNALDRYADGDTAALSALQKRGLGHFFVAGCAQCHWGPRMTDDAFHVVRFPTGRQDGKPDRGRLDVLPSLAAAEFVATSKWSDSPASAKLLVLGSPPSMLGAFKTPPLRGVARTAPFGHGGTFATLLDVSKHYGTRGDAVKDDRAVGLVEEWVPLFDANVQGELPAILEVLVGDVVP